jgi:phosphatidylglycerophosphate synthase
MVDSIKKFVRASMTHIAGFIDYWADGRIKPAHITTISFLGHFPAAWALINNKPVLAAGLIAFFGLMDSLDGALARLQGSASLSGMFFDAVSDRFKEIIIYSALAVYVYKYVDVNLIWQVVALCGTALLVSYTKAKGEMALSGHRKEAQKLNKEFSVGIASYEIRMFAIIAGLILGILPAVLPLLIAANVLTISLRFLVISKILYQIDQENLKKKHSEN